MGLYRHEGGTHKTGPAPRHQSQCRGSEDDYKKPVLSSTVFLPIAAVFYVQPSLIGRPIFPALPASSSPPTKMDDSTSHPLEHPISWDKSMLAKHDTVYRQATLIGSR